MMDLDRARLDAHLQKHPVVCASCREVTPRVVAGPFALMLHQQQSVLVPQQAPLAGLFVALICAGCSLVEWLSWPPVEFHAEQPKAKKPGFGVLDGGAA